ncbi:GntR family transcriptional regulator [Pontivivens insulae]|uniref:HTH-type transcriptional regulator McbR n=1 Tax=Pontivivens insulae TaxID=1639689 RepID=A0A2R8A8F3_9RHOB|nr:GntR family transcriptional regulator [Pontivivens insulae]RED18619.1 GntR family transcriptional regulator [Pontivivens insulae]SPF28517.1 HTH-type transcriptional regulator McbR [Pontivivens insulae]
MSDKRNIDGPGPAHERVYRSLRNRILHGEIEPGESLTLRGIASELGVSMTPVREALRRLVAEGALTLSKSGRIATPALTNERIEELAAIRALLEPELAARAMPRAHMALIERLQDINGQIQRLVSEGARSGYVRANMEFHRSLYLRAQAPAMLALTETVWLQSGPTLRAMYATQQQTKAVDHHMKIIAALKAGDEPGLRLAVRADVTGGLRMLAR